MAIGAGKVWGIDLGRSAVKGVLLKKTRGGVEILKCDMEPLKGKPAPSIMDPSRDPRMWEALKRFQERNRIVREKIVVAIPGQNVFNRNITVALVGKRPLDELIQYEASNEIPFVLDEVIWDYHLFQAPKDSFERDGLIFAAKKASINTYLHAFSQAGFDAVDDITLASVSLLNFFRAELADSHSSMIIDIGAETTDMLALAGDRFWIRSIPFAGYKVTQLIEKEFDIPFEQAEAAKQNVAKSRFAEQIVQTVMPSMHEFISQMRLAMTYFRKASGLEDFERIYLIGGGSRLLGLRRAVSRNLGREPSDLQKLEHVFVNERAGVETIRDNFHRLCVAIGAGAQALRRGTAKVSFVPYRTAKRAEQSRRRPWVVAALVIVSLIVGTLYGFERALLDTIEDDADHARSVSTMFTNYQKAFRDAINNKGIIQELNVLASAGCERKRIPLFLNAVVKHFSAASSGGRFKFKLHSFKATRGYINVSAVARKGAGASVKKIDKDAEPGRTEGDWYMVEITGGMTGPRGADSREALDSLDNRLIFLLRKDPIFLKLQGQVAQFTEGKKEVKGQGTQFLRLVRSGDLIKLDRDGTWYRVDLVQSNSVLVLSGEFEGESLKDNFTVCRIKRDFDREHLTFRLYAEIPMEAPEKVKVE